MKKLILAMSLIFSMLLNVLVVLVGLAVGLAILAVGKITRVEAIATVGWHLLIAYDQAMNAATGGDPDETISSRTGKLRNDRPWAKALSEFLDWFQRDHAELSIEPDEGKDRIVE